MALKYRFIRLEIIEKRLRSLKENLIKKRVKRFFEVSSLLCSCCGELGCVYDEEGNVMYRPDDYGLYSKEDWDKEMDKEISWMRDNKRFVLSVLPVFKREWPECCKMLKQILLLQDSSHN